MVTIQTNQGDIVLTLDTEKTPKTVENFLQYVKDGFYDQTIFHRVIDDFMIQGGGFDTDFGQKTTRDPIENEADKANSNLRGTIAMARTMDPHSASAQFFINVKDNTFLDYQSATEQGWGYCVFGKVSAGMEVVDAIKAVATGFHQGHDDVPVDHIIIEKVTVNAD